MEMYNRNQSLMSDQESEKLQLFVSCRKLADLDFITVTDSFLIVRMMEPNKPPRQILRTKVYQNDLNPNYAQTVIIDYFFEIRQKLVFQVYHYNKPPTLVGRFQTTVGAIFGAPSNGLKSPLINKQGKQSGQIIVRVQKVNKMTNKIVSMNISARNLPQYTSFCCFFGGTSPFFRIVRVRQKNDQLLVDESEVVELNQNPVFKPMTISQRKLCRNNQQLPFQIRFFNYSSTGSHKHIGTAHVKLFQLQKKTHFDIIDNDNKMKGVCIINNVKRTEKFHFGDYIFAGLQLALITCIDFTGSNGIQSAPTSLHYVTGNTMSQYQQALYQVSKILLDYDYDKLVPTYGFGAKVKMATYNTQNHVHHCFPLNGQQQNSNCYQVQGIMKAYRQALPYLDFGGPTYFSKLFGQAINEARALQKDNNKYIILFILTDGQIHDKKQVIDQLVQCCRLPISIIIVGIGNGDFGIMHELDDDDCLMVDSKGNKTTRDLVQFVQFNKFKNNGVQLARQVLQQLPRQIQQYYQLMGMTPKDVFNAKQNYDIKMAAQNYVRPQNYQPMNANMNGNFQRQATWQQQYFQQNTFNLPPPPQYKK